MSDDKKDNILSQQDNEKRDSIPSQQDLERDISEYLSKKYGERIKILGLHAQPEAALKEPTGKAAKKKFLFDFNIKPEELIDYLDEYVIRQDEAKAVLATKICTHFNRIRQSLSDGAVKRSTAAGHIKNNVLIIGPTGVGKTFLVKLIAKRLGVPFVKGDATKFSETGYVGGDVEDLIRDLVREADNDIESAQHGIIYVDEIDKIATSPNRMGPDVSRSGVQRALLKPMEETEVDLKVPHDPVSQIEAIEQYRATGKHQRRLVNTRNILFIMSGAFTDLDEIVKKRLSKQAIGFEGTISSKKDAGRFLKQTMAEDLIKYGFESEFIGRLPVIACLETLSVEDLHEILRNPNNSVVVGKKLDFQAYGINIQFTDEALLELARQANAEQTGARGLISVMEKILLPFEKKLPSTDIKFLAIDLDLVLDPKNELRELLESRELQLAHEKKYHQFRREEHGRLMEFILKTRKNYLDQNALEPTPIRLNLMARKCQEEIRDTGEVCAIFAKLAQNIRNCAAGISKQTEIEVVFSDEAIDLILARPNLTPKDIDNMCRDLMKAFEYGLELLAQKKKSSPVVIPPDGVLAPEEFINNLVAERFRLQQKEDEP